MAFTIGTTTSSGNAFIGGSAQRKVQLLCDGSLLVVYHDGSNWQAKQVTNPVGNPVVSSVTGWPTKAATAAVPDVLVINNGAVTSDIWVVETQTNVGVTHGLYTPGSGVAWDTTTQISGSSTSAFWPQIAWTGTNLVVACQDKPGGTNFVTTVFWTATKNGTAGWSAQISGFESNAATSSRFNRPLLVHDATVACCLLVYSDAASSPYPIRTRILSDAFTPALANWGPQVDLGLSVDLDAAGGGIGVTSNQYDDMNGLQAIIDPKTSRFHLLVTDGRSASVIDPYYLNGTIAVDRVTVANNKITLSNTVTVDTDNHNTMVAVGIDGAGQVWIFWGNEPGSTSGDIFYTTSGPPYSSVSTKTNLTNNLSNNNQGTHIPQNVGLSGAIPVVYAIGSASPWTVLLDTTLFASGAVVGGGPRRTRSRYPSARYAHRYPWRPTLYDTPVSTGNLFTITLSVATSTLPSLLRQVGKVLAVATTTAPTLVKQVGKLLTAASTTAPVLVAGKLAHQTLSVVTTTVPSLIKQVGKLLSVTETTSPSLVRLIAKGISVTTTTAPSIVRQTGKLLTTATTTTPTLLKRVGKVLSVVETTVPALVKLGVKNVVLSVVTTTAPSMVRQVQKLLSVTTSTAPAMVRLTSKILSSATTTGPVLLKKISKTFSVASTTSPTLAAGKIALRTLSAATITVPSLVRQVGKSLSVSTVTNSSLVRRVGKVLTATTTTGPTVARLIAKMIAAVTTTGPLVSAKRTAFVVLSTVTTTVPSLVANSAIYKVIVSSIASVSGLWTAITSSATVASASPTDVALKTPVPADAAVEIATPTNVAAESATPSDNIA